MSQPTLEDLAQSALGSEEPRFVAAHKVKIGSVDPLGLREINFDLMDEVLPGLNNVARHIRPFVVVTWAWRRARQIAESLGQTVVKQEQLQDFVDRIEVLFVLSQMLRKENVDLPGRQYLAGWAESSNFEFGGDAWRERRNQRRLSTALSAPIQYGPGLRALGWVAQHPEYRGVMVPAPAAAPALDALETELAAVLHHDVFSSFGTVTVTREEARTWGQLWDLEEITGSEAQVMRELLCGASAPDKRRLGVELLLASSAYAQSTEAALLRKAMAGSPSDFTPARYLEQTRDAWRRLQVRQLFRLSLEALFYWMQLALEGRPPLSINSLVTRFLEEVAEPASTGGAWGWVESLADRSAGPVELAERIQQALGDSTHEDLARCIAVALGFCLTEPAEEPTAAQPTDRLPLSRAREQALARAHGSAQDFVRHVFEAWVLAQHAYWSVGRGLTDARAGGRKLLRLRIILDEGGWTLTPEAPPITPPSPTRDRLQTAITLCEECGLLEVPPPRPLLAALQ